MLIQSINDHTSYVTRNPHLGSTATHCQSFRHTALSKTANTLPLQTPWWGRIYLAMGARSELSFSRLHPCISATNSSEQLKILYRACKLKPYKKTACGVPNMSWVMWALDYQIYALAAIDAEDIIFQAQLHLIAINRKPSQKYPKVDHRWDHFE